jgi:hypothetical protein
VDFSRFELLSGAENFFEADLNICTIRQVPLKRPIFVEIIAIPNSGF